VITADTITDEQIEALRFQSSDEGLGAVIGDEYYGAAEMLNMCDEALGQLGYGDMEVTDEWVAERVCWARARCAEILNARGLGKTDHDGAHICDCSSCRRVFPARDDVGAVRTVNACLSG
jgi:hypothetical protein